MRFLNKYKLHEHYASASRKLPVRVSRLKRSKWTSIKKKLWIRKWTYNPTRTARKRFKDDTKFTNFFKIHVPKRKFYLSSSYKLKIQTKKYILSLYDNSIKTKLNKKIKFKRELICNHFTKPLFHIDVLLWYLNCFTSAAEARLFLNSNNVLANGKVVRSNYIIKKGDVISLNPVSNYLGLKNSYKNIKAKFKKNRNFFFPFLEYDYYTNSFVVLKNWRDLSYNDLTLIITENKKIRYALYK